MPGIFDNAIINQVQQANDIIDVISEHVSLVKKGREMAGLCPFHDDHSPSMFVNPGKQIFKCFACGAGGDVFKFLQMRENLTFPQAIERLAERAGIKLQKNRTTRRPSGQQSPDVDPNMLARANAWAAKFFAANLADKTKGQYARDYLAERKIPAQSIEKWQIGLAINSQDDLITAAQARKIPMDLLVAAGLATKQNSGSGFRDRFINRLMFTITDVTGRVIGFGGRTLDNHVAKYLNSPTTALFDKSNSIYGLQQARHKIVSSGTAIVVEGYTDCIMAHANGCENVVAALGTSFTNGHGRMLRRYAKRAVLIFDSDVAGLAAANRALEVCLSQRIDIKIASLPQGKDPCDFILMAGQEGFEEVIESAVDVFEFKWDRLMENFDSDDTLAGKKAAIEEFLQTIATALKSGNMSVIERGLIINRLSKIIGTDTKQINIELDKRLTRTARSASYNVENQKAQRVNLGDGFFATAQREVLEVLLNQPQLFDTVKQKITPMTFDSAVPELKQIAVILFEMLNSDSGITLATILAKIESVELGNIIVGLASAGEEKGNFQSRLTGALDAIERFRKQGQKSDIKAIENQSQFLRNAMEKSSKHNPHNLGMM